MEYYLAIKKNEVMPFVATWMDLEIIILSKVSQKDKYHMISLIHGISNTTQTNISMNQKQIHRQRTDLWFPMGKGGRGGGWKDWEFGISRGKLLFIEWINSKILLYSTGNCIQYPVTNANGKEYEKLYIYMYN